MSAKMSLGKKQKKNDRTEYIFNHEMFNEALAIIPVAADLINRYAIYSAVHDINTVEKGFLIRRRFVRVIFPCGFFDTQIARLIRSIPEIDSELISAIISEGLENVKILRDPDNSDVYIEAWMRLKATPHNSRLTP